MDTVDYIGARGRLIKGIHHLLNWTLIVPLLMLTKNTDSSNQTEPVICCQGDNASFPWTDEIPPFYVIEWYFENTQLAEASESLFSQDSLLINSSYTGRFHLHDPGKAGFNLTEVSKTDEGNYRCIITLQSTDIQKELKRKLTVEDCYTSTRSSHTGEGSTTTIPTPTEDDYTVSIVLGVLGGTCIIIALLGLTCWRYRRRTNNPAKDGAREGKYGEAPLYDMEEKV